MIASRFRFLLLGIVLIATALSGCTDPTEDAFAEADDVRFRKETPPDVTEFEWCPNPQELGPEHCEYPGAQLACRLAGYASRTGYRVCRDNCLWDSSECLLLACGTSEPECDPVLPDPSECPSVSAGPQTALRCTSDCRIEEYDCPECGDGVVNGTEECEPGLGTVPCDEVPGYFGDGNVPCDNDCTFPADGPETACQPIVCGDGIVSRGEACDPGPEVTLGPWACPYGPETYCSYCTQDCRFRTTITRYCGDGRLDPEFEPECDETTPNDDWCGGRGYASYGTCVDCALVGPGCDAAPEPEPDAEHDAGATEDIGTSDVSPRVDRGGCAAAPGLAPANLLAFALVIVRLRRIRTFVRTFPRILLQGRAAAPNLSAHRPARVSLGTFRDPDHLPRPRPARDDSPRP